MVGSFSQSRGDLRTSFVRKSGLKNFLPRLQRHLIAFLCNYLGPACKILRAGPTESQCLFVIHFEITVMHRNVKQWFISTSSRYSLHAFRQNPCSPFIHTIFFLISNESNTSSAIITFWRRIWFSISWQLVRQFSFLFLHSSMNSMNATINLKTLTSIANFFLSADFTRKMNLNLQLRKTLGRWQQQQKLNTSHLGKSNNFRSVTK